MGSYLFYYMVYSKENIFYLVVPIVIIILIITSILLECIKQNCTIRIRKQSKNSLVPASTLVQL